MSSMTEHRPLQVATFETFPVNQVQRFNILLDQHVKSDDLFVSIANQQIGSIEKQLDWSMLATNGGDATKRQANKVNKCTVSFKAPVVGAYTIKVELLNQPNQNDNSHIVQFLAKAYDLSKVFIHNSPGRCRVNESYEFSVDASEAGEGQLEIAVNEGEIPNQVQVLDNGKCIVDFKPEEPVPHIVDIKFNGHNVNGCPFYVQVERADGKQEAGTSDAIMKSSHQPAAIIGEPKLIKDERVFIDSIANFALCNIRLVHLEKDDIIVDDPGSRSVDYSITNDPHSAGRFNFEFKPATVGDYTVHLKPGSQLLKELPPSIIDQFPFSLKVFDFNKVLVSSVTNGVTGHPIYFFIDASEAGSGNLEIRVLSKTRPVPNHPESEANAKIRVNFTPTEAVDHTIDVKFNGISVPNNPFVVRVAQYPQARVPVTSRDMLKKYLSVEKSVEFYIDYIGSLNELKDDSCSVNLLKPNFTCVRLDDIQLIRPRDKNDQAKFKISFKATEAGPHKLFIVVNNEIIPGSPLLVNFYNIHEVRVTFEKKGSDMKPLGRINEPVAFTVDASRAGEGTLALVVNSSHADKPIPTEVHESEEFHGLYYLNFIPTEFTTYKIEMSFNGRMVPNSPFIVDIQNAAGELASDYIKQPGINESRLNGSEKSQEPLIQDMSALSLMGPNSASKPSKTSSKQASLQAKEDELFQSIVVHGVSLKRTPVNSTGAFIIETNRTTNPIDFDVLIADPYNSMVVVQCYRDQGGNLIAEWTPVRVGTHKIEVLYKDKPVPNSPFMSEAFDPSGVHVEPLKTNQFMLDDIIELKINKNEAGQADLEIILTDPNGEEQIIAVQEVANNETGHSKFELVRISPKIAGEYRVNITFGGYEVPKSPVILNIRDNRNPVKISGNGLVCAEVNRTSQFNVESSSDGELKMRIECVDREIVPKVKRKGRTYVIKYKPTDVGYATISLYWDGTHIDGSPFSVPINDLSKFLFMNSTQNNQPLSNQIALEYEPRVAREIILDTSKCGPGELRAEAYCRANPGIKFSMPSNQMTVGRYKLTFICPPKPEQVATGVNLKDFSIDTTYLIRFYYNNLAVPETLASVVLSPPITSRRPTVATSNSRVQSVEQNNNDSKLNSHSIEKRQAAASGGVEIVALRGHGLAEAKCGKEAGFTIDGRGVGHGKPEVKFYCQDDEIRVKLEFIEDFLYKATYVALSEGTYTLNVLWDGKQVAGCPITVNILPDCDPSKVICTADSMKGGVLGEEIKTFIDTRKAGPGELTALCTGPQKVAFCELLNRGDGTFVLYIKPQESGRHFLTINYGGQHIPKSPFSFKVSGKPDPTKVRVYGPGIQHGVLSLYQSRFVCDTRGAGAGQMTVRIRGPKGAFRIDTQRENRTILCKYDPTEPGDYRIEIKWSDRHVPNSPFSVMIFDTQEELNQYLLNQPDDSSKKLNSNGNGGNHLAGPAATHQMPSFQPTLVEYGHYSSAVPATSSTSAAIGGQKKSQYRLG